MGEPSRDRDSEIASCGGGDAIGQPPTRTLERWDIASVGFDETRQLVADGFGAAARTGLRVPPATSASIGGVPYRFVLAVADLDVGDRLVDFRQSLEVGAFMSGELFAPAVPIIATLSNAGFRFPDGGATWWLTEEPLNDNMPLRGPFDQDSFRFADARCALVYAAARFPAVPLLPGYLGLNAYTPPARRGRVFWKANDVRNPWQNEQSSSPWRPAAQPVRIRFGVDVRQHDPTAFPPPAGLPTLGAPADYNFWGAFPTIQYWSVWGRLTIERARSV